MDKFGFIKANQREFNFNLFINHILPVIYAYREKKNERIKKVLNLFNNSDKILDLIDRLNCIYYDDEDFYHDEVLNIRISKSNMRLFDKIFTMTK